ncbi:MAG: cytochrome P450 [Myxococcota bacterium]
MVKLGDSDTVGQLAATTARFAARRQAGAVGWDADLGTWAAFRYAEVRQVLTEWETFSSVRAVSPTAFRPSLITTDPPRHPQLRGLLARDFTPRAIALLEPRIREVASTLLAPALAGGGFDLVADFAHPLPVIVIAEMLGVPASDRPLYRRWAEAIVGGPGARLLIGAEPTPAALAARGEMDAYFVDACRTPGRASTDGLLAALLNARIDGDGLEEWEILSFCSLLLLAGHITTVNLIGNTVYCLSEHPEALARLQQDPALLSTAVEEVLRYMSPVQGISRVATRPVELGGVSLREGDRVVAWIASANRDERVFAEADRFDVGRRPNPHLAFGMGSHFCLGAPLARLEGRIALQVLLEHLPKLRPIDRDPPRLEPAGIFRGFTRLPVQLPPH